MDSASHALKGHGFQPGRNESAEKGFSPWGNSQFV